VGETKPPSACVVTVGVGGKSLNRFKGVLQSLRCFTNKRLAKLLECSFCTWSEPVIQTIPDYNLMKAQKQGLIPLSTSILLGSIGISEIFLIVKILFTAC
jgi:hypothetical protein